jgi:hypothetical protein
MLFLKPDPSEFREQDLETLRLGIFGKILFYSTVTYRHCLV